MNSTSSHSSLVARRGELMAELFLQGMEPQFLSRPTSPEVGYDLLVGFANERGGINTFAVEVKATERMPGKRFPLARAVFERFASSNIPGLLLVVDAKENRIHYAWLTPNLSMGGATVSVPLVEINNSTERELRKQFASANAGIASVK